MEIVQWRRHFLASASLAAAAGVLGARSALADEGPPEVTTSGWPAIPGICVAPGYIADELLRAEGFTDIRYLPDTRHGDAVARGEVDFDFETAAWIARNIDAGEPITALAGVHVGCFELFAHEPIRSLTDLKGRRVGIPRRSGSSGHLLLASMAAYVGLDPKRTSTGSPTSAATSSRNVRARQGRRLSRLSARAAGAARPQHRSA